MSGFVRVFALFGLFVGGCFAAENKPDAEQMLQAMINALDGLNYQGTIAFYKNNQLDTMKFYHAVSDKGVEQERLLTLNSPIREIVLDADKVRCVFLDSRKTIIDHWPVKHSFLLDLPKNLNELNQYYLFINAGQGEIAQLPAYIIDIKPKDNLRYARKIWINRDSFLPLKFELLNQNGFPLEQAIFTDLEIKDSLPIVEFNDDQNTEIRHIHRLKKLPFEQAGFEVTNMPGGFVPVFYTRRPMHGTDQLIDHLLLSDGFSSVSVYVEQYKKDMGTEQRSLGAINLYSRRLDQYQLTVMGDVPARTVRYIADGVMLRNSSD